MFEFANPYVPAVGNGSVVPARIPVKSAGFVGSLGSTKSPAPYSAGMPDMHCIGGAGGGLGLGGGMGGGGTGGGGVGVARALFRHTRIG